MRECRNCQAEIPKRIRINGELKNLQNRRYCLTCSPFGQHNTRAIEKPKKSKQRYREYSDEAKELMRARVYWKRILRKELLVKFAGGKCSACGYDKCLSALDFHHKKPECKNFTLDSSNLQSRSVEEIRKEFEKCILLCRNCHAELHSSNPDKYLQYKTKFEKVELASMSALRP